MSQIYRCLLTQKALFFLACVQWRNFWNRIIFVRAVWLWKNAVVLGTPCSSLKVTSKGCKLSADFLTAQNSAFVVMPNLSNPISSQFKSNLWKFLSVRSQIISWNFFQTARGSLGANSHIFPSGVPLSTIPIAEIPRAPGRERVRAKVHARQDSWLINHLKITIIIERAHDT